MQLNDTATGGGGQTDSTTTNASGTEAGSSETVLGDSKSTQTGGAVDSSAAFSKLNIPSGLELSDAEKAATEGLIKELGFTQAQADKLLELRHKETAQSKQAQARAAEQKSAEQARMAQAQLVALQNDPEFGGARYEDNKAVIGRAIQEFGSPELQELFNNPELGFLGNHPAIVRAFYRIGLKLSEDSIAGTTASGGKNGATDDEAYYRKFYNHPTSQSMFRRQ